MRSPGLVEARGTATTSSCFPLALGRCFACTAEGGTPAQLTTLDPKLQETAHRHPWFLPDGRHFLYAATATSAETMVYVGSLDQDMKVPVVQSDTGAIFAEGYLLFVRQSTLLALPFDLDGLKTSGDPVVVAQNISNTRNTASASFSAADKGVLSYWAVSQVPTQLTWVSRTGELLERVGQPADQTGLELSPDGKRVAVSVYDASRHSRDIWIHDFARNQRTRLSSSVGDGWSSSWSPAGDRIAFSARRTGLLDLYQIPTNGEGGEQELGKEVGNNRYVSSWSADFLLYQTGRSRSRTGNDIWALPMSGDVTPRPFLRTSANENSRTVFPRWTMGCFHVGRIRPRGGVCRPLSRARRQDSDLHRRRQKSAMATRRHRDLLSGSPPCADGRRRERTEFGIRSSRPSAASSSPASEPRAIRAMAPGRFTTCRRMDSGS